jgi:hypothetical protein
MIQEGSVGNNGGCASADGKVRIVVGGMFQRLWNGLDRDEKWHSQDGHLLKGSFDFGACLSLSSQSE